jgi:hypothetical protein
MIALGDAQTDGWGVVEGQGRLGKMVMTSDEGTGPGVLEDILQFPLPVEEIHGNDDRPQFGQGVIHQGPVQGTGHHQDATVSRLEAEAGQPGGQSIHPVVHLAEGDRFSGEANGRVSGDAFRRIEEKVR